MVKTLHAKTASRVRGDKDVSGNRRGDTILVFGKMGKCAGCDVEFFGKG
jgi:hypothetical protein